MAVSVGSPQPCNVVSYTVTNSGGGILIWSQPQSGQGGSLGPGESTTRSGLNMCLGNSSNPDDVTLTWLGAGAPPPTFVDLTPAV